MGLKDKLLNQDSNLTNLDGTTPPIPNFKLSKRHFEYSINGNPNIPFQPSPSQLDLNGKVPSYNYKDNAPEGASF